MVEAGLGCRKSGSRLCALGHLPLVPPEKADDGQDRTARTCVTGLSSHHCSDLVFSFQGGIVLYWGAVPWFI